MRPSRRDQAKDAALRYVSDRRRAGRANVKNLHRYLRKLHFGERTITDAIWDLVAEKKVQLRLIDARGEEVWRS